MFFFFFYARCGVLLWHCGIDTLPIRATSREPTDDVGETQLVFFFDTTQMGWTLKIELKTMGIGIMKIKMKIDAC